MAESFIKPKEYVNPIGIGAWLMSHEDPGMVIRSSVFLYEKTVWRLSPWRRFQLKGFIISKLQFHTLIVVSKMKGKSIEKFPCIWLQTKKIETR